MENENAANRDAGAEATITVPTSRTWKIHGIFVQLVTDANAADRRVHFEFVNQQGATLNTFGGADHAASLTRDYNVAKWGVIPDNIDDDDILIPLPQDIILASGSIIRTVTTNLQVGDDFGIMVLSTEQYFEL